QQHLLYPAPLGLLDELLHPVLAPELAGHFDHHVVGLDAGVLGVAGEALQAGRAGGEHLDLALPGHRLAGQQLNVLVDLLFLAEADLAGNVGAVDGEGAGLAAATVVHLHAGAHQRVDHLLALVGLHRVVAGLVVEVLGVALAVELDALLHQVLVDVEQTAAVDVLLGLVLEQLVHAGAAGDDHRLDVHVVQGGGHPVEQDTVGGGDGVAALDVAGGVLRVAAADVTGRQHHLGAGLVQHGDGGQPDLPEQPLRAAAGEVEHGVGVLVDLPRVTDDGHVLVVLQAQVGAGSGLGRDLGQRPLDHADHLDRNALEAVQAGGVARAVLDALHGLGLSQPDRLGGLVAQALGCEATLDQALAHGLDGVGVGDVEERHAGLGLDAGPPLAALEQDVAHADGNVAEIDVHRAGVEAAVADGAVVGDIVHL